MKKLLLLIIIVIAGYVIYVNLQVAPEVRVRKALTNRWFNPVVNQNTAFMDAVESFDVDTELNVTVNLTPHYQLLGDNQLSFLKGMVFVIRTETLKHHGTITFKSPQRVIATVAKDNDNIVFNR